MAYCKGNLALYKALTHLYSYDTMKIIIRVLFMEVKGVETSIPSARRCLLLVPLGLAGSASGWYSDVCRL